MQQRSQKYLNVVLIIIFKKIGENMELSDDPSIFGLTLKSSVKFALWLHLSLLEPEVRLPEVGVAKGGVAPSRACSLSSSSGS